MYFNGGPPEGNTPIAVTAGDKCHRLSSIYAPGFVHHWLTVNRVSSSARHESAGLQCSKACVITAMRWLLVLCVCNANTKQQYKQERLKPARALQHREQQPLQCSSWPYCGMHNMCNAGTPSLVRAALTSKAHQTGTSLRVAWHPTSTKPQLRQHSVSNSSHGGP